MLEEVIIYIESPVCDNKWLYCYTY